MTTIRIPRTLVNQILTHAQQVQEQEICGLLSSKDGEIVRCYPVRNVAKDPAHFFQMDGKEQIDAMRAMRENDETLYAIYHSHPESDAYPSATDVRESQYPDAVFIIVSLKTKGVLDLRAYRLNNEAIEPLEIHL